jgi:heme exporter protein CcmD
MGKYAVYILSAYGVSAAVIGVMVLDTLIRARRWRAEVKTREQALKPAPDEPPKP